MGLRWHAGPISGPLRSPFKKNKNVGGDFAALTVIAAVLAALVIGPFWLFFKAIRGIEAATWWAVNKTAPHWAARHASWWGKND